MKLRRSHHVRRAEGTVDIALLIILLLSTILPATFAVGTPDWMDKGAGLLVLYGGAIAVAIAAWRWIRRVIREARRHGAVLLGLDERMERVEARQVRIEKHIAEHLGVDMPEDPATT